MFLLVRYCSYVIMLTMLTILVMLTFLLFLHPYSVFAICSCYSYILTITPLPRYFVTPFLLSIADRLDLSPQLIYRTICLWFAYSLFPIYSILHLFGFFPIRALLTFYPLRVLAHLSVLSPVQPAMRASNCCKKKHKACWNRNHNSSQIQILVTSSMHDSNNNSGALVSWLVICGDAGFWGNVCLCLFASYVVPEDLCVNCKPC